MRILWRYLREFWGLVLLALVLAAINQLFSLLDPAIFRYLIDRYATQVRPVHDGRSSCAASSWLLAAAVGVAFVSRVAKNFQDYFVNVITQRLGARMYSRRPRPQPRAALPGVRGPALGRDPGTPPEGPRRRREAGPGRGQHAVHHDRRRGLRDASTRSPVHWLIAPLYFMVIGAAARCAVLACCRGASSACRSRSSPRPRRWPARPPSRCATSSWSRAWGSRSQEIDRLNGVTERIVGLELKKVRYLRSLSFIQGTSVNFLRTSILFVMLWLVFRQHITVGQFFSLYIYSFFIFGPLQELGTVINVYREAEASLGNFEAHPRDAEGAAPRARRAARSPDGAGVRARRASATLRASSDALSDVSFDGPDRARRSRSSVRRGRARRPSSSCWSGCTARPRGGSSTTACRTTASTSTPCAAQIGFVTQETQLFAGTIRDNLLFVNPRASDAELREVLGQGRLPRAAGPRRPGPRHGDRRGRHEGLGGRAAAPVDRPRPAAARPAC